MNTLPPLSDWPAQLRALAGLFTAIALFGFICGFLFLDVTTHLTPDGIITHYNGLPEAALDAGGELKFEKSLKDMLTTTHNHVLGLAGPFFLIGFLFVKRLRRRETERGTSFIVPFLAAMIVLAPMQKAHAVENANTQTFNPAVNSKGLAISESGDIERHLDWQIHLLFNYAYKPAVLRHPGTGEEIQTLVKHRLGGNLLFAIGFVDWIER